MVFDEDSKELTDDLSNESANEVSEASHSGDEMVDTYDFMDSMMEDMFGDESEIGAAVEESLENEDENVIEGEPEDNYEQTEANEASEFTEEVVPVPKRKVPLFQQLNIIEGDDDEASQELSHEEIEVSEPEITQEYEEIVVDEVDEQEEIADENIESLYEESTESLYEDTESSYLSEDEIEGENDFIDDMLSEIVEDSGVEFPIESNESEVQRDENIKVPLEKPGMEDIKVTPDGKTLAEMLPTMRGGRRKALDVIADLNEGNQAVEVDGEKRSDGRYTSAVRKVEKKRAVQDKRRELSTKFHQRNAKFTEQEKIIMENLGVTNEQFAKLMGSTELSLKEKEEIIGLGRYGAEKHFKGRKYRTTVGDMAMLEFLTKFKFANTRILRWISNEPQGRTWRKLNRLRENGLVESESLIGIPDLWAATYAGVAIAGYDYPPGLRPMPKMITISSSMGVNYLAACLWFNTVNVLNLDDFPAHNRIISTQEDGRNRVRGEMLVSELEIRSSLGKEINPNSTTMKTKGDQRLYDVISANVRSEFEAWEASGRAYESPEMQIGNEYMWVLYPTSGLTMSYHVPDLVVKRERGPQGEPKSIAVEVERYDKSSDKYDKIMLAYKLDEHLYEKVIWVTPDTRVARKLQQAAENVGFDRYAIIPILTEDGVYDKPDIWMI